MASKKHARRRAREGALALLYSSDITEQAATTVVQNGLYPDGDVVLSDYAEALVSGVVERLDDIDAQLASTSENWSVERMPVVDRAILRLAVYEMLFVDEVPVSVAINEAVELAKLYGGEDESSRFVNGVLGRIARSIEADAGEKAAEQPEAANSEEGAADSTDSADASVSATEDAAVADDAPAPETAPDTQDEKAN